MKRILLCLAGLFLAVPLVVEAQTTGTLAGTVTDANGVGIPGATVLVVGTSRGDATNVDGEYLIAGLRAGTYTIRVSSAGQAEELEQQVTVSVNTTTTLDFQFTEEGSSAMGDTIIVIGRREPVDAQTTGKVTEIGRESILNGTSSNIFSEVSRTTSVNTSGGGIGIRGGRRNEASIRRDGFEISDPVVGGTGNLGLGAFPDISPLAVEQIQILASGFEAEYGDVISGVQNTVTRTGRNDRYHGTLSYRTQLPFLYGSSDDITVKLAGTDLDTTLPGYKLETSGNTIYEFGVGGYVPGIKNDLDQNAITFFISGRYNPTNVSGGYDITDMSEEYAAARADIADAVWGYHLDPTNLSDIENERVIRNISGKLRWDIASGMYVEAGGEIGATRDENYGWTDIYKKDHPVFTSINESGEVVRDTNFSVTEGEIQATDDNTIITRITGKFFKQLAGGESYFEVQGGWVKTEYEIGRKNEEIDYGLFSMYDIPEITDEYNLGTHNPNDTSLVRTDNTAIDIYEAPQYNDTVQRNPLTGLYEGPEAPGASRNPYGTIDLNFPAHGNARQLETRTSQTLSSNGTYETNFFLGDAADNKDNVRTKLRAGYDLSYYTLRRHNNSLPWSVRPFFDVYGHDATYFAGSDLSGQLRDFLSDPYHPMKGAVWTQAAFNYKTIVFKPGLRFDFFNPNTQAAPLTRQGVEEVVESLEDVPDATVKFQVSPRLGISYPITERSNFRVNFAMMFKMPEMTALYDNAYGDASRGNQLFGNPDIEPQKVIVYDLGYESYIGEDFAIDVSAFYRDIYNQSGVTYVPAVPSPFILKTVEEYGNVRGLEVTLTKRRTNNIYGDINYTLQRAVGTASSPTSNYSVLIGSADPYTGEQRDNPLTEFPLSYDQTHSLNAKIGAFWGDNQGPTLGGIHILENMDFHAIGFFSSGLPYTAVNTRGEQEGEFNASRYPSSFTSQAFISKTFLLRDIIGESGGQVNLQVYLQIYNLLNNTGATSFYAATGNPDQNGTSLNRQQGEFTATPYFAEEDPNRPETYSSLQFDPFGTRYYNPYADVNLDGVVNQAEKFASYQRLVATVQSQRRLYANPRTFALGVRLNF